MSANTLTDAVYNCIFPGGLIPIRCKDNIAAIDARIQEIEELAQGKIIEGMNRRIKSREASQRLTEQIVALRDSCSPPMSYREIMRRLGNVITPDAARNRYDDFTAMKKEVIEKINSSDHISDATKMIPESKTTIPDHIVEPNELVPEKATIRESRIVEETVKVAAPPALQEAKPEQVESATNRNSRTVQESAGVRGDKWPLTQAQKDKILEMHAAGKSYDEIKQSLKIDGRRIVGIIRGQEQRERMAAMYPKQPEAAKEPSLPGAEGAPETTRVSPRGIPEEARPAPVSPKPDPKLDYYEVADAKIINMKRRGLLNHEIAQVLERNPGGRWDVQKVDARYTELKRQGLV